MTSALIRILLLAAEVVLAGAFLAAFPYFNSGNIAALVFLALIFLATLKWDKLAPFIAAHKIFTTAAAAVICAGMIFAAVLSAKMYRQLTNEPEEPKLLVVLGCKVRGETPSKMLRLRCDRAASEMAEHPDLVCVVSGGKGHGENISEAEAMKRYIVGKGIDPDRIIKEDRSTSTAENIKFSFELTDALGLGRDITIVTDGYHQYRASLIAKKNGADKVTAYSADTERRFVPSYWVREWLGIVHFYLLGR